MRTCTPDQQAVKLAMMLLLVGKTMPEVETFGADRPFYIPEYVPKAFKQEVCVLLNALCERNGMHYWNWHWQYPYDAWDVHETLLCAYRDYLFTQEPMSGETKYNVDGALLDMVLDDKRYLWKEFVKGLLRAHTKTVAGR